jgi:sigma-B regulation protein RsbU (phosphoserine phosphatase)
MLEHASRVFSESTLPSQYATLVCGHALPDGRLELFNAGHPAPLLVRDGVIETLGVSDLPIGLFRSEEFSITELTLQPGEGMLIYSDGVSEAIDASGGEYGIDRLRELMGRGRPMVAAALLEECRQDFHSFCRDVSRKDDVTLFVIGR